MSDQKISVHNRHLRNPQPAFRPIKKLLPPTRMGVYAALNNVRPGEAPTEPPPAKYICFKCAEKGHWIFDCPLGPEAKKKFRMATGIPRPMLRIIPREEKHMHENVLILPDGQLALLKELTEASFEQQVGTFRTKEWKCQQSFGFGMLAALVELICPACGDLFKDPMQVPCCLSTICSSCIKTQGSLLHLQCPVCYEKVAAGHFLPNTVVKTLCETIAQCHVTLPSPQERKCMEAYLKGVLIPRDKPLGIMGGDRYGNGEGVYGGGGHNERDRERELMWERDQHLVGERAKEYAAAIAASSNQPPQPPPISRERFEATKEAQAIVKKELLRRLVGCMEKVESCGVSVLPPATQTVKGLLQALASLAPSEAPRPKSRPDEISQSTNSLKRDRQDW